MYKHHIIPFASFFILLISVLSDLPDTTTTLRQQPMEFRGGMEIVRVALYPHQEDEDAAVGVPSSSSNPLVSGSRFSIPLLVGDRHYKQ